MIRDIREDTELKDVKRNIETIWLDFSAEELDVYKALENITEPLPAFSKITFLRELCSSREACYLSLQKMTENNPDLVEEIQPVLRRIEQLPHHVKAQKTVDLIKSIGDENVIVFTEYRA